MQLNQRGAHAPLNFIRLGSTGKQGVVVVSVSVFASLLNITPA